MANLGFFGGKGQPHPAPAPPPEDLSPTITPEEELMILNETLPQPEVQASFVRRNVKPLLLGGSVLVLGALGMILLIKA